MNTYKGKIEAIESTQSIAREGKEPFLKRRVMLDVSRYDGLTGEKREKHIIFEFNGKSTEIPNAFKVGDYVEIAFDVESFKGTKKDGTQDWFTSVRGYRIDRINVGQQQKDKQQIPLPQKSQEAKQQSTQQNVATQRPPQQYDNGLPF